MKKKQPHIIIINPDQMRADSMGHLGNQAAHTPHLDNFAKEGVSFSNAFVQNPVCTPSRCSFMSGLYPHVHGHRTISYMMHTEEPVLLKELKQEGYHVWINGRNDLISAKGRKPFKSYANTVFTPKKKIHMDNLFHDTELDDNFHDLEAKMKGYQYSHYLGTIPSQEKGIYDIDTAWVEGAIDCIHNRPKDKPLCMFLPLLYPHPPYTVEQKYMDLIDETKIPPRIMPPKEWKHKPSMITGLIKCQGLEDWNEDMWLHLRKTYLAMCARVDNHFGQIIQALKDADMYDDSAIFFFSDHGDYTGDYGIVEKNQNTFEDCLTNVPFLIKFPSWLENKPGIRDALVELVDFYATVEDITGMKPTHTHFGKSLQELVQGKTEEHRDMVFCEGGRLKEELHCSEGFHYPNLVQKDNVYYPRISLQVSQGAEHTKATMIRNHQFKYVKRLDEKDELYCIQHDPGNLDNLIDKPEYQDTILAMRESMLDWLQRTADIVPFEEDERFDKTFLLMMLKSKLPRYQYWLVKLLLACGMSTKTLMGKQQNSYGKTTKTTKTTKKG